jgi:hypothetical protein
LTVFSLLNLKGLAGGGLRLRGGGYGYEVARDSSATAEAGGTQTVMRWVRRYSEDGPGALEYRQIRKNLR